MKSKATYHYATGFKGGRNIVAIMDKDDGDMSLTNDIENVISDIAAREGFDPNNEEILIIYRDSTRLWDGYEYNTKSFIPLRREKLIDAIEDYVLSKIVLS